MLHKEAFVKFSLLIYSVYDGQLDLVQVCNGHTENIKDIIYLPEESEVHALIFKKLILCA